MAGLQVVGQLWLGGEHFRVQAGHCPIPLAEPARGDQFQALRGISGLVRSGQERGEVRHDEGLGFPAQHMGNPPIRVPRRGLTPVVGLHAAPRLSCACRV